MRHAYLAIGLSLLASIAGAFEIEDSRTYPGGDRSLRILSTADINVFEPIISAFHADNPALTITYDVVSSTQLMQGIYDEGATYDLAISSAMDLQLKLANDGFAQVYRSDATDALADGLSWRNEVFAFTREPAVLVVSEAAFAGLEMPTNRESLISLLRARPDVFAGRIGTYDVRESGLGYLFATQDSRNTETYWQLVEIMGRLDARLYCCSGAMISDVASGELAIAYNVLGSYADVRAQDTPGIRTIEMDDYVSVMLRSVLIPKTAQNPDAAGAMVDFLLSPDVVAQSGLPPLTTGTPADTNLRPIRLDPGLLVFLDGMRRENFLRSWTGSILQNGGEGR